MPGCCTRTSSADAGRLPPALPIVLYNGRDRWSAPVEEALARYQPSQRYFLTG